MIVCDCGERELANFWNMLPSCVCKKKWSLFTACSCKGLSCCMWRCTQHLLGRLNNVKDWPSYVGMIIKGGYLSEVGSLLSAFCFLTHLCGNAVLKISPPGPVRECLWMDALPSFFSKFWVCDTCTFSKQIYSAYSENIMVHFLNSCGR